MRIDRDRGLKWELNVYGGPASANSVATQIGFSKCCELSRKSAHERPGYFQAVALPHVNDRDILIVDDILDSGHTLAAVREKLETAKPRSVRVCVLLSKKKQRARNVNADYVGFEIEDEFVVGYGLDFRERYRNLPYIGVLRKDLREKPSG